MNIFIIILLGFAAITLFSAIYIAVNFKENKISTMEKIPRNIPLGIIFGIIAISWCIPQTMDVFSSNSLWGFISGGIIIFLLCCFFLDYLFARALAGFLILLAHYFLWKSFATEFPVLWLFSLSFLIIGTFGIIIGGIPYLMKELIRKLCKSLLLKRIVIGILIYYFFLTVFAAIIGMQG